MEPRPQRSNRDHPAPPPGSPLRADRSPRARLAPRRVIVACSEPSLAVAVRLAVDSQAEGISPTGVETLRVLDGQRCLQELELAPPDLLLIHLSLDKIDGAEVVRRYRAAHPGVRLPVVFLSALYGEDVPSEFADDGRLALPFDARELAELSAKALLLDSTAGS